jgi:hypothetical protein
MIYKDHANFLLKSNDLWAPKDYLAYYTKPFNIIIESGIYCFVFKLIVSKKLSSLYENKR